MLIDSPFNSIKTNNNTNKELKKEAFQHYKSNGNLNKFYYETHSHIIKDQILLWEKEFWNKIHSTTEEKTENDSVNQSHLSNLKKTQTIISEKSSHLPSRSLYDDKRLKSKKYIRDNTSNNTFNSNKFSNNKFNFYSQHENYIDFDIDFIENQQVEEYSIEVENVLSQKGSLLNKGKEVKESKEGKENKVNDLNISNNDYKTLLNLLRIKKKSIESNPYYDLFNSDLDYIYMSKNENISIINNKEQDNSNIKDLLNSLSLYNFTI